MGVLRRRRRQDSDIFGKDELEGFEGLIDMLKPPGAVATFRDGGEDEERRVAWRCVGGDSGESEWWVAGVGGGCVEWGIGKRRRYWPGGGRGGIALEGIASQGVMDGWIYSTLVVGRTRLEESGTLGRLYLT